MTGLPIRRNTALLSASMGVLYGTIQLGTAVGTTTLVLVTGVEGLVGLGPGILLSSGAVGALLGGRAMDRVGRVPVLAAGYGAGLVGSLLVAGGVHWDSAGLVVVGFVLVGASVGTGNLSRMAGADMYPPERRARGISLVLFGSLFGALLGPLVFMPLFAGKHLTAETLVVPWLAAAGLTVLALVLVLAVRPDPRRIAELLGGRSSAAPMLRSTASLSELVRRPGAIPALTAAVASFAVMVGVMSLAGYIMVGHGHDQEDVFPVLSAHFVGMFALVLVVGELIDRLGRRQALVGGLVVMAASTISLLWIENLTVSVVSLLSLGLGWNFSFVAATAELTDATVPSERGRLLGFGDLLSGLLGAGLALIGGYVYTEVGLAALATGTTVIAVAPALWIVRDGRRRGRPALETAHL